MDRQENCGDELPEKTSHIAVPPAVARNLYCICLVKGDTMDARCPVCGEELSGVATLLEVTHAERQFCFCSLECSRLFLQFPEIYEGEETDQIEAIEDLGY
jgi:hypothetical protein